MCFMMAMKFGNQRPRLNLIVGIHHRDSIAKYPNKMFLIGLQEEGFEKISKLYISLGPREDYDGTRVIDQQFLQPSNLIEKFFRKDSFKRLGMFSRPD
jgi:hypothetical protein